MGIDSLGGFRLVRKLGEGPRAEVFLGHPLRSAEDGDPRAVAIKAYRPGVSDASIAAEIESLHRAAGEHALPLLDVTTDAQGAPALILQRLPGTSLARLLRDRARLHPGEAITILAPLALTIARLHAAGVVHGALRQDAVLFDPAGAPVLCCFGRAFPITPGQPPALLDAVPGVALDIRAFASLAGTVLAAVDHPGTRALGDWVQSSPELESSGWFDSFADRLFDLGLPAPIDFTPDATEPASSLPGRLLTGTPVAAEESRERVPGWLSAVLPDDVASTAARVRGALRAVRTRVWVAAGAVGVALIVALVAIPQGERGAAVAPPSAVASASATPVQDAGAVGGDDPVAALVALLEVRQRCIRDLSVLCLDAVDQPGSAALSDDEALVRSLQDGAESPEPFGVEAAQVTVEERLGDSAILDLADVADSEPASVLLMKGEAGWRIRDYLEE